MTIEGKIPPGAAAQARDGTGVRARPLSGYRRERLTAIRTPGIWRKLEKHTFQTLGFAYIILGAILIMGGLIELSYCGIKSGLSSGLTLVLAGIVLLVVVRLETGRADRGTP